VKTTVFDIDDMNCGSCVRHVTAALMRLDGVEARRVTVGTAEVAYDEARTNLAAVAAAISATGYPARERPATTPAVACHLKPENSSGCCCIADGLTTCP
jgi:copper chaperone